MKREPFRVAYVISTLDTGGAEVQLVNTVNALPPHVHPVIFVLRDRVELRSRITNPRAEIRVVGLRARWDPIAWLALARQLRALGPSVVHSHMLLSNLGVRLMAPVCGRPRVVSHEHGLSPWKGRLLNGIDKATQGLSDVIVVVSEASRSVRLRQAGLAADRVAVLPNAIDWERFASAPRPAIRREQAVWGVAARLTPVKRVELALELLSEVRQLGVRPTLRIAGDGPERGRLELRAFALGLGESVTFLGAVDDMVGFYSDVDAVLLTSESEDCPMTVLEALASGKFVAATAVGGVPELLDAVEDAVLFEADAPDARRGALTRLAAVRPGFDSPRNRERARRYDVRAYVDRLLALYGSDADIDTRPQPE